MHLLVVLSLKLKTKDFGCDCDAMHMLVLLHMLVVLLSKLKTEEFGYI
jgi:hypothetical protein